MQAANAQQLSTLTSLDIVPAGFPTTQKVGPSLPTSTSFVCWFFDFQRSYSAGCTPYHTPRQIVERGKAGSTTIVSAAHLRRRLAM